MSRKWSPAEWNAFVKGPLANAITEQANREALEAGLFEMDNGQKMRILNHKLYQTGALVNSVKHKINRVSSSGGEGQSGPTVIYGRIHEFGGVITAKNGPYLHFFSKKTGQWVKTKSVTIPARPYMRPTVDEDKDRIVRAASTAFESAIERLF